MTEPRKLIIFDLDGTLIDSRADLAAAVNLMRHQFGLALLPLDVVTGYVGDGVRLLVQRALQGSTVDVDRAVGVTKQAYAAHLLDQTVTYPGAQDALVALRQLGYRTAVVTNKPHEFTQTILAGLGLAPHLDAVLGGGVCAHLKPHPEPILHVLRTSGCGVPGSWIVGDNHTDLAAGRATGLLRCFCTFGFGDRAGEESELTVGSLSAFVAALQRQDWAAHQARRGTGPAANQSL